MSPFLVEISKDLKLARCPRSLAPTLVTLPSMSRVPRTPFSFPHFRFSAFQEANVECLGRGDALRPLDTTPLPFPTVLRAFTISNETNGNAVDPSRIRSPRVQTLSRPRRCGRS